ncbi:hypothetical protein [Cryobacterium suzukii]|uniref:hypothetical protein n=1 Tax=Cryobacterium suzukii TaxID=1259198 RepID=UPI001582119C|nr:hypothetical protein [Cryobacterium suzukii]
MNWNNGNPALRADVEERQSIALRPYEVNPDLLEEHVGQEDSFLSGGYGTRQVSGLLQNAVDALTSSKSAGTIEFRVADGALWFRRSQGTSPLCRAPHVQPNSYHQMVGRGLRGPKNGGNEICLIVNVADTFEEFGEELAFTEFSYLWEGK